MPVRKTILNSKVRGAGKGPQDKTTPCLRMMGFNDKHIERDHDRKGMSEMTQGITQSVISDKIRASKAFFTTPLYRFIIMSGVHYFAIHLISKIAGLLAWQILPFRQASKPLL